MLQENELKSYIQQLGMSFPDYPSASNRGVITTPENTVFSNIDFIQATFEAPRKHDGGGMFLPFLSEVFTLTRERHGIKNYRYGSDMSPAGTFFWNTENDVQPGYMVLTGDDLGLIRARSGMGDDDLINLLKKPARRFTRIDFATTIDAGHPMAVLDAFNTKKRPKGEREVITRAQSARRIDLHGKRQGYTVYIGSEKSDKFIRCYDKAAELKMLHTVLTRIEMQTGGDVAHRLAHAMAYGGVKIAGKQAVRDFCQFPKLGWWGDAMNGEDMDLQLTPAKTTSFAKWLSEQVYPAIEKRVIAGQEQDAIESFTRAVVALYGDISK